MTVSEMSTMLGSLLNDINGEVFTATDYKLPALNVAQRELVLTLLGYQYQFEGVTELLTEIQEVESPSIGTGGIDIDTSITERYFLRNGFVNASIVDNDGYTRWCTRIPERKIGITENRYNEGTTRDPQIRIFGKKIYLMVSIGDLPRTVDLYYVGQPYGLATTASGTGRDQYVTTCELNPLLHDLIVLMAEVKCRRMRGTPDDFQQAQLVNSFVMQQIQLLATGAQGEPKVGTFGQFTREQNEFMKQRMENTQWQRK